MPRAPAGELERKVSRSGRSVTPKRNPPKEVPKGEDDTKVDNNGFTQAHRAACRGDEKLIASIWGERKDEVSARGTAMNDTPAHLGAMSGQVGVLRAMEALPCGGVELLFHKARNGQNIGHMAATYNQPEVLKWMHSHENEAVRKLLHGRFENGGHRFTPLQVALKAGAMDSVQFFLSLPEAEEYLMEEAFEDKRTAGHFAIFRPKALEAVFGIKDEGLKGKLFMSRDHQGDTPLMAAAMSGDVACIPMLVDAGYGHPLDTNCNFQFNLAHNAVLGDQPEALDWVLAQPGGEDLLRAQGKDNLTPLACCSMYNAIKCLKWFLTKGKMKIDDGMPEKGLVHWMARNTLSAKPEYLDWISQQEGGKEVILGREGSPSPQAALEGKCDWAYKWIADYKAKL